MNCNINSIPVPWRRPGKTGGAIGFALTFFVTFFCQEKKVNKLNPKSKNKKNKNAEVKELKIKEFHCHILKACKQLNDATKIIAVEQLRPRLLPFLLLHKKKAAAAIVLKPACNTTSRLKHGMGYELQHKQHAGNVALARQNGRLPRRAQRNSGEPSGLP